MTVFILPWSSFQCFYFKVIGIPMSGQSIAAANPITAMRIMLVGIPARKIRDLTEEEIKELRAVHPRIQGLLKKK